MPMLHIPLSMHQNALYNPFCAPNSLKYYLKCGDEKENGYLCGK